MERFVAGNIVVVPFPFTDLSSTRKRPALVLSNLESDDIIICEITSVIRKDRYAVQLENKDLESGKLKINSIIRPNRIVTIHKSKINYKFGRIKDSKLQEVLEKLKIVFNLK
ncbi:MAG: type II toxin-antitoxin system PemK/MazF family toxin [Nanoarchaeota archaeon]